MPVFTIQIESERPPRVFIGDRVLGGEIKSISASGSNLATAKELANEYNLSTSTVRSKLALIREGTAGKALYDRKQAAMILNG